MGESDDGSPIIWVSGRGGWYEINPSPAYQSVYNKMCQATTLYYTFMDTYNLGMPKKSRKSKGSIPNAPDDLSHLFLQVCSEHFPSRPDDRNSNTPLSTPFKLEMDQLITRSRAVVSNTLLS